MQSVAITLALILVSLSAQAEARECYSGKPCGDSCIAADKTCHLGRTPTSTSVNPSYKGILRVSTVLTVSGGSLALWGQLDSSSLAAGATIMGTCLNTLALIYTPLAVTSYDKAIAEDPKANPGEPRTAQNLVAPFVITNMIILTWETLLLTGVMKRPSERWNWHFSLVPPNQETPLFVSLTWQKT